METCEEDPINRKPTEKDILVSLNEYSKKKNYSWSGKGYWGSRGKGETLYDALLDDADKNRSSIFDQWADNNADALFKDKSFREEYIPTNTYNVYVVIGTKGRKIHINTVHAGNKQQAIDKLRQDIGAEFLGLKYTIEAEHKKPDEYMTEDKFRELCHEQSCDDVSDIKNMIEDVKDDQQVADWFGITFTIDEWECENGYVICIDDVKAICSCGRPMSAKDLEVVEDKEPPSCEWCGADLRTKEQQIVDAI